MTRRLVLWSGLDGWRAEAATVDLDAAGLQATGSQLGVDPLPYRLDYALSTYPDLATRSLQVQVTGDGWARRLRLDHDGAGGWRCDAGQDGRAPLPDAGGDAAAVRGALDCDLARSPLTNTMPIRRHALAERPAAADFLMAFVSVPDLGVDIVAGVLLDHVDQDPPQRHRLAAPQAGGLQGGRRGGGPPGVLALRPPGRERLLHVGGVDVVEVAVRVVVGPVDAGRVLAAEDPAEPVALHVRHVPDEAEQRQARRRHRPLPQLRLVEPLALPGQRRPVVVEPGVEHGPLAGHVGRIDPVLGHGARVCTTPSTASPAIRGLAAGTGG